MSVIVCVRGAIFRKGKQSNKCSDNLTMEQIQSLISIQNNIITHLKEYYDVYTIVDVVCTRKVKKMLYKIFNKRCLGIRIKAHSEATQTLSIISSLNFCHSVTKQMNIDASGIFVVRGDLHFFKPVPVFDSNAFLQMPWQISDKFVSTTKLGNIRVCDTFFYTNNSYLLIEKLTSINYESSLHDISDLIDVKLFIKSGKYDTDSAKEKNPFYKIVNRTECSIVKKYAYNLWAIIDIEIAKACGTLVLILIFIYRPNIFTGALVVWYLFENPTHCFCRIPRIKLTQCPNKPSLIILNHTAQNYYGLSDGFFLKKVAQHLYLKTNIPSSVIVNTCLLNRLMQKTLPTYLRYVIGSNRVEKSVEELKKGRNVIIFLVDPKVPKCGGTGIYYILKAMNVDYFVYYIKYENKNQYISITSFQNKYNVNDYDANTFVLKISEQFSKKSGSKYFLKRQRGECSGTNNSIRSLL